MPEDKQIQLARYLIVAWYLGYRNLKNIPVTADELMRKGNDGLNWQIFLPVAEDILREFDSRPELP